MIYLIIFFFLFFFGWLKLSSIPFGCVLSMCDWLFFAPSYINKYPVECAPLPVIEFLSEVGYLASLTGAYSVCKVGTRKTIRRVCCVCVYTLPTRDRISWGIGEGGSSNQSTGVKRFTIRAVFSVISFRMERRKKKRNVEEEEKKKANAISTLTGILLLKQPIDYHSNSVRIYSIRREYMKYDPYRWPRTLDRIYSSFDIIFQWKIYENKNNIKGMSSIVWPKERKAKIRIKENPKD